MGSTPQLCDYGIAHGLGEAANSELADREEQMLIARFGDQYRNYMARTGQFIPRILVRKEAKSE